MSAYDVTPFDLAADSVRVLIVDDDEVHANCVADVLRRVGCVSSVACSFDEAIDRLGSQTFDVVVSELMMDDVDGLEILRQSKELLPDAKVILLTSHASLKAAVAAGQHGIHSYLLKPMDPVELRRAVEAAALGR